MKARSLPPPVLSLLLLVLPLLLLLLPPPPPLPRPLLLLRRVVMKGLPMTIYFALCDVTRSTMVGSSARQVSVDALGCAR